MDMTRTARYSLDHGAVLELSLENETPGQQLRRLESGMPLLLPLPPGENGVTRHKYAP